MSMEGWVTRREVVTFVECRGCDYKGTVRNGHPKDSGRRIPTLSQSRQRELVRVPAGFEYTTYIYSTWSMHYFPMVIM